MLRNRSFAAKAVTTGRPAILLALCVALAVVISSAPAGAAPPHACPKLQGPSAGKHPRSYYESDIRHDVKVAKCLAGDTVLFAESFASGSAQGDANTCNADAQESPPDYSDLDAIAGIESGTASRLESANTAMLEVHSVLFELGSFFLITNWHIEGLADAHLLFGVIDKSQAFVKAWRTHISHVQSHDCSALSGDVTPLDTAYREALHAFQEFSRGVKLP